MTGSWDAMLSNEADVAQIKTDHGLAQAKHETRLLTTQGDRFGHSSLKQGHRAGFWDGVFHVLGLQSRIDELTDTEMLAEIRKGAGSIYWPVKADDARFYADCPTCNHPVLLDERGTCDECGYDF